ncbi:MAG: alpha-phosphoglucomutase [Bacteroidota bacterium]|jgi:phosphoglucomutase
MQKIDFDKIARGIDGYLDTALQEGKIDRQSYDMAKKNTMGFLQQWLTDENFLRVSPNLRQGILAAVDAGKWEEIVNTFRKKMSFGTGGIRGFMAGDRDSIVQMKNEGLDAPILKGPNTINNVVLLLTSAGVAKFGRDKGFDKIVIGYDSRVRGGDFAKAIAEEFLAYGFTVYLFDEACPFPEVTFAIPYVKAQMGILLSASHNDYRYNGYKLCCGNGSQFDPEERTDMYNNYIAKVTSDDIKVLPLAEAPQGKVVWLGGPSPQAEVNYYGHSQRLDIHKAYGDQVKRFLLQDTSSSKDLHIAFCPYHGAGRKLVPQLLREIGFHDISITNKNGLNELNGLFPSFNNDPGMEQQPDPGDRRAAKIAVDAFIEEYGAEKWKNTDVLIGTDPDADRCGLTVKVPASQRHLFGNDDYTLLPADDAWALLLWYRLMLDKGIRPEQSFIVLSHTTTDALTLLARKFGIGVIKTWVGFAALSAATRDAWYGNLVEGLSEGKKDPNQPLTDMVVMETHDMTKARTYNLGSFEQSNGFALLGYPPADPFSLGEQGHVRDKDGTFAAILLAEIAQWAKDQGTTIFELIDKHVYLDKEVGLFYNHYEPDPIDGEYPGIEGDRLKKSILRRALGYYQIALAGGFSIGGLPVSHAVIYRTGKYDHVYPPTPDWVFPDEGVRFYFGDWLNHLTVRPSGTGNALRLHIQLHTFDVNEGNLVAQKQQLRQQARQIANHIRELLGAPRSSEF